MYVVKDVKHKIYMKKRSWKKSLKKKIPKHELGQELTLVDLLDTLKVKGFDTANTTLSFRN